MTGHRCDLVRQNTHSENFMRDLSCALILMCHRLQVSHPLEEMRLRVGGFVYE